MTRKDEISLLSSRIRVIYECLGGVIFCRTLNFGDKEMNTSTCKGWLNHFNFLKTMVADSAIDWAYYLFHLTIHILINICTHPHGIWWLIDIIIHFFIIFIEYILYVIRLLSSEKIGQRSCFIVEFIMWRFEGIQNCSQISRILNNCVFKSK